MKNIFYIMIVLFAVSCKAQTYPLRTYTEIPENAYLKDTNNELQTYEGTWKGTWNNKTIYITLKKITNKYDNVFKYYRDYLIAKFKVIDNSGNILFDNNNLADDKAKINGGKFRKIDNKYSLNYIDPDLCFKSGFITIQFIDSNKTKLEWNFMESSNLIEPDCFYHSFSASQRPEPLPVNIILTKQ
ncbi:DUF6705 family protein [Cloacibacterium sp.]|uniref:DUF6705 family protein n=1 Tax=Cloacibacterium sp. TaxID=1913682 RepID=UPI0039E59A0A